MRIERVGLRAFGPFSEREVAYAPGLTVVAGPNESGKSTIHAGTYAALCGMRRGKGAARVEDRKFALLHRPWDGKQWLVTAVLRLEDGRRIELRHDLDGKVDSRATDLAFARDVSSEIIFEGAPDSSRWLGLDRRSFGSTACVSQAEILAVIDAADALQEHLQRAAATAGADETAAAALSLIGDYRREYVGLDRANAKRPLRAAIDRESAARDRLAQAREAHESYDLLAVRKDVLDDVARTARSAVRAAEAAAAVVEGRAAQDRFAQAQRLTAALAARAPDPRWLMNATLSRRADEALASWSGLGPEPVANGPSPDELRREIATLPEPLSGDTRLDQSVVRWRDAYVAAHNMLALARESEPARGDAVTAPVSAADMRSLADLLDPETPSAPEDLQRRRDTAATAVGRAARAGRTEMLLIASAAAFLSVALVVTGAIGGAGAVATVGAATTLFLYWRGSRARTRTNDDLAQAEAQLESWRASARETAGRRDEARRGATEANLPTNSRDLRALADTLVEVEARQRAGAEWRERVVRLEQERDTAARALSAALLSRGVPTGADLITSVEEYAAACAARAETERAQSRREGLERQLAMQEQFVANATGWHRRRAEIEMELRAIAVSCDLVPQDAAATALQLREWQARRTQLLAERDARLGDDAQLAALLGDASVDELKAEAERNQARADRLSRSVDPRAIREHEGTRADAVDRLRAAARDAADQAAAVSGQLSQLRASLPPVAETEEELEAAQRELQRVRTLEATLERATEFLERAQSRVHRDIAPVLAHTVTEWLPRVTAGRYTEAIVDPETLAVSVRHADGDWREAAHLSQGTFELVYVLLRVALARHLVRKGECAPLLFDDVTVQCDTERTGALMDLLHDLSAEQQVIVFSQEEDVREWAALNLREPQDHLELLDRLGLQ